MKFVVDKMAVGIISIIAGLIILIWPAILAWVIGIFLVVYGILILLGRK